MAIVFGFISESSVPLVFMYVFVPLKWCFCYYGSVVQFEDLLFFAQNFFWDLLCFHVNFKIDLSISVKNDTRILMGFVLTL
jgi:hypothetical protein